MPGMKKKAEAVASKYMPLKGKPGKGVAKKAGAKKPPPFKIQPVKRGK